MAWGEKPERRGRPASGQMWLELVKVAGDCKVAAAAAMNTAADADQRIPQASVKGSDLLGLTFAHCSTYD